MAVTFIMRPWIGHLTLMPSMRRMPTCPLGRGDSPANRSCGDARSKSGEPFLQFDLGESLSNASMGAASEHERPTLLVGSADIKRLGGFDKAQRHASPT